LSWELTVCYPWSRMSGGCVKCRPGRTREVSGAWRCCRAPLSWQARATVPVWEAFPEVNRVLAGRLLGLLVERMVLAAVCGGSGGERGERCGQAVGAG
jgi:hypothetical protein